MNRCSACLLAALAASPVPAAEVDSFTQRYEAFADATRALDAHTNALLDRALARANQEVFDAAEGEAEPACRPRRLYHHVRAVLGRRFVGQLEVYVHRSDEVDKRRLTRAQSIYRDFRFYETPSLGLIRRIGAIVRIGEHIVGSDKFGHFFAEGYSYFKRAYRAGGGLPRAFRFGERSERILYGGLTTGVYSYADLVANFNGMRFWTHLLGRHPDPLGQSLGPYVGCRDGRWVRLRDFSWADYVDAGWDEGVNCNAFRNRSLLSRVERRLRELEARTGRPMRCPVTRRYQAALRKKYGAFYAQLINDRGLIPVVRHAGR